MGYPTEGSSYSVTPTTCQYDFMGKNGTSKLTFICIDATGGLEMRFYRNSDDLHPSARIPISQAQFTALSAAMLTT